MSMYWADGRWWMTTRKGDERLLAWLPPPGLPRAQGALREAAPSNSPPPAAQEGGTLWTVAAWSFREGDTHPRPLATFGPAASMGPPRERGGDSSLYLRVFSHAWGRDRERPSFRAIAPVLVAVSMLGHFDSFHDFKELDHCERLPRSPGHRVSRNSLYDKTKVQRRPVQRQSLYATIAVRSGSRYGRPSDTIESVPLPSTEPRSAKST